MQSSDFPNLPRSWQQLPFSQCIDKISIKHKVKQKEYLGSGKYPIIDQAQKFISGYCNDEIAVKITKPIIVFGDHTRCFKFVDFNFVSGADGIHILQPKDFFNEKLFYYFCLALDFPNKGYSRHYQYLAKTMMKIPPLEIQKRIVKRLDEAFSRIESGTKHLQSAKDNLAKYKQSLLKSAFNGTLTQDCPLLQGESTTPSLHSKSIAQSSLRGSGFSQTKQSTTPSLRANEMSVAKQGEAEVSLVIHESKIDCHESLRDSRNDENSPYLAEGVRGWVNPRNDNALDCHADKSARNDDKDSLNDKSANLPQGWTIKTLGEVCDILDNMRKPINATEREQRLKNSTHKYAYYGATGQVGYIDDFLCDFESILLGEDGAPFLEPFKDKAYIVSGKYWVNNHAHILRAKKNLTINKFLCHFLNIVDYMPYVSGTTRLKLN